MTDYELYWTIFHFMLGLVSSYGIVYLLSTNECNSIVEPLTMVEHIYHHDVRRIGQTIQLPNRESQYGQETKQRAVERLRNSIGHSISELIQITEEQDYRDTNRTILTGELRIIL